MTRTDVHAAVEHVGKMRHQVTVSNVEFLSERLRAHSEVAVDDMQSELQRVGSREFVFYSDEPAFLGGDDACPAPLEYFAGAIGT